MAPSGIDLEVRLHWREPSLMLLTLCLLCGCGGRQARIDVPDFAPDRMATEAVSALDKNGDGLLDGSELAAAPGLRAALASIDTSRDGKLDTAEIKVRVQSYRDDGVGMLGLNCVVLLNGRPLSGATVDFIPEAFLANELTPAQATTRGDGSGVVTQTDSKLPAIAPGMYRVIVSKKNGEKELIPARYNSNTTLGFEVTQQGGGAPARFELTSP